MTRQWNHKFQKLTGTPPANASSKLHICSEGDKGKRRSDSAKERMESKK